MIHFGGKKKIWNFDQQRHASSYFIPEQTKRQKYILFLEYAENVLRLIMQWITKQINFKELTSHDHTYDENRIKLEIKKMPTKIEISLSGF